MWYFFLACCSTYKMCIMGSSLSSFVSHLFSLPFSYGKCIPVSLHDCQGIFSWMQYKEGTPICNYLCQVEWFMVVTILHHASIKILNLRKILIWMIPDTVLRETGEFSTNLSKFYPQLLLVSEKVIVATLKFAKVYFAKYY